VRRLSSTVRFAPKGGIGSAFKEKEINFEPASDPARKAALAAAPLGLRSRQQACMPDVHDKPRTRIRAMTK